MCGPGVVVTPTTTFLVEPGWRLETGAHGEIWYLKNAVAEQSGSPLSLARST